MAARSSEARKVLRELEKERDMAAAQLGQKLEWSAAESTILAQISTLLDRKADLLGAYEAASEAGDMKLAVKLSAEIRLLEQAAARLVERVKTSLPEVPSRTSAQARRAARARWDREAERGAS